MLLPHAFLKAENAPNLFAVGDPVGELTALTMDFRKAVFRQRSLWVSERGRGRGGRGERRKERKRSVGWDREGDVCVIVLREIDVPDGVPK